MPWKPIGTDPSPPQRPTKDGCGTIGRPIHLTTNFFRVDVKSKKLPLYHYDVTIRDHAGKEDLPKKKKMSIFEEMKVCFPKVFKIPLAYDSMKNAYSVELIPQLKKNTTYEVDLLTEEEKARKKKPAAGEESKTINRQKYSISLGLVNQASLNDLFESMVYTPGKKREIPNLPVQMIEVMFRHYRAQRYVQVSNRSFFSLSEEFSASNPIGGGKEGVTGFFGSLRPAAWKDGTILLNLDMANTAFFKAQSVIDYIKETEDLQDRDFSALLMPMVARRIEKSLKNLKIRVTHAKRTYRFTRFTAEGADRLKFDLNKESGTVKITVQQYMKDQYSKILRFPRVNCIQVGNIEKNVFLPMELCEIEKGQRVVKKLSDIEVSNLIRSTAVPPAQRLKQIQAVAKRNEFNKDPMLKALGFTIADMPLTTTGRVLPAPGLTMDKKNFQPYQGTWDVRDKMFHHCAELQDWAVINYDRRTQMGVVQKFLGMLISLGTQKGMKMNQPFDIYTYQGRGDPNPLEDFQHYKNSNPKTQLIMCILPGRKYYGAIKKAGDTQVNIITQCVIGTNVFKAQPQTVGNILLKINAKMGGVNNIVTGNPKYKTGLLNFAEPFIVMGADVNHPPAGNKENMPSLAAVVGSYDLHATKYALERRVQQQRTEIIVDLTDITRNLLKTFYKHTNARKPNRIIMYRDGVSESQFKEVLASEMNAMRKACTMLDKNYKPGITFICVQKRHHTRLFCDERDGVGKSKNVPPGTIVDRDITHPTEIDFYLCSHQGIQGTSKPTHYHILWDDNDLPIDELQMLTYKLCHVYSRCARAVSIPTPVYYAHWAAFRAKVYVQEILGMGSDSGSSISMSDEPNSQALMEIRRTAEVRTDDLLSDKLHYI